MLGAGIHGEQHRRSPCLHKVYGGLVNEVSEYRVLHTVTGVGSATWVGSWWRVGRAKSDLSEGVQSGRLPGRGGI